MAKYNIYCTQRKEVVESGVGDARVKDFAFDLIKDRSTHVDDEYGRELGKEVQKGLSKFTFERAEQVLNEWEYRLFKA